MSEGEISSLVPIYYKNMKHSMKTSGSQTPLTSLLIMFYDIRYINESSLVKAKQINLSWDFYNKENRRLCFLSFHS